LAFLGWWQHDFLSLLSHDFFPLSPLSREDAAWQVPLPVAWMPTPTPGSKAVGSGVSPMGHF